MKPVSTRSRLPVALPLASLEPARTRTSEAPQGRLSAGNTGPSAQPSVAPNPRRSRLQLAAVAARLSPRDYKILEATESARFITTKQLEALIFTGHASKASASRTSRRVLERLHREHLIDTLERRVGGVRAGSAGYIWHLTATGARLLAYVAGEGGPRRFHEPSQRLLDHCLMIVDIHLRLRTGLAAHNIELTHVAFEPDTWRRFTALGGEPKLVRPDLAAITTATTDDGQVDDYWLLEADNGTEHPPTVVRACQRYLAYFATGVEQARYEVLPRVVWVVPHDRRQAKLDEAFNAAGLDRRLFRITTLQDLPALIAEGAE